MTDGVFGTYTTLVPYMRQWFRIYNSNYFAQGLLPAWYYGLIGLVARARLAASAAARSRTWSGRCPRWPDGLC